MAINKHEAKKNAIVKVLLYGNIYRINARDILILLNEQRNNNFMKHDLDNICCLYKNNTFNNVIK